MSLENAKMGRWLNYLEGKELRSFFLEFELVLIIRHRSRILRGEAGRAKIRRIPARRSKHSLKAEVADAVNVEELFDFFHGIVAREQLAF